MPPKSTITKQMVLHAAFDLVKEQGIESLTTRSIAQKLQCSTQPIYSVYGSMEAVLNDVFEMAIDYTVSFITTYSDPSNTPVMNMAIGCLLFAQNEKQLFRTVFLSDYKTHYFSNHENKLRKKIYSAFMQLDKLNEKAPVNRHERIFQQLSIYLIGIGALINTNSLQLDIKEATSMIEEMYEALVMKESLSHS